MNKKRLLKKTEKSMKFKKQDSNLDLLVSFPEEISNNMNCK